MQEIGFALVAVSLLVWLGLLGLRGRFWQADQILEEPDPQSLKPIPASTLPSTDSLPCICAVIPARNEAELLPVTLRSLLLQEYPGSLKVILVDDQSTDGTAEVARQVAESVNVTEGKAAQLQVITAQPLPGGWSGKLWAMQQGIQAAGAACDYLLLTDADIQHDPANVGRLVRRAVEQNLDLTSIMVRLRCESFWEQLLIPAFVFFFAKLYPFRWVNDPQKTTAAAAGGCILIRKTALDQIGGLQTIRQALIDDCALAQAVKHRYSHRPDLKGQTANRSGKIWLGLSDQTRSLRPYPSLQTLWEMVSRTAFTQLNYSLILLIGTVLGMGLVYLMPIAGVLLGLIWGNGSMVIIGLMAWLLMSLAYWPTVRFYRCNPVLAISLPWVASLYTLMTIDSALRYWQGRGGAWKGRVYPGQN